MIVAKNLSKKYKNLTVFENIDIEIQQGETVSLVGASGAGKSSLLQILGLLDTPSSGEVYYFGQRVDNLNAPKINEIRNQKIGFVFQFHHLFPEFSALENVCIPSWIGKTKKKEAEKKAIELLEQIGLKDRIYHKPKELSGGEQQRVAVARALINNPDIVFADEPTGNLDSKNAKELHLMFQELNRTLQKTFLIVTHNAELAKMCHRTLSIQDGQIIAS